LLTGKGREAERLEEAGGWVFAVILGPVLLGAILAYAIARNRKGRGANIRSPSYEEGEPGGRGVP
jgi:hypothetical protein